MKAQRNPARKNKPRAVQTRASQLQFFMATKSFDIVIVGSGSAGISAAEAAVEAGAKSVAIIEANKRLGGECPNLGCVPTKALLRSVEVMELARRGKEFGIRVGKVEPSFKAIMNRKTRLVNKLTGGGRLEDVLKSLGVTLIKGRATFTGKKRLSVGQSTIKAKKIILATGSRISVPPIEGLKSVKYWTYESLVNMKKLPKSVAIIGGGPIGVESAQILAPFGVGVTMIEFQSQLIPREEPDVAELVERSFKKQGIATLTASKVTRIKKEKGGVTLSIEPAEGGKLRQLKTEQVMIATGKKPNLEKMNIEKAGIKLDEKGRPKINNYLQTTNPSVFIVGDAAGQMLFTHVAHYQGEVAAINAVKGKRKTSDLSVVPRGTFCQPEVGSVGMTEKEAVQKGYEVGVGKALYAHVGKALVSGEMDGFVKIIADKKTKRILGGHVVGAAAAELVHEIALAMQAEIPYTTLANMIHAYPTFAEVVGAAAYDIS